jgi:hypothetical protein
MRGDLSRSIVVCHHRYPAFRLKPESRSEVVRRPRLTARVDGHSHGVSDAHLWSGHSSFKDYCTSPGNHNRRAVSPRI